MSEHTKVLLMGGFAVAAGATICLVGLGVIPVDPSTKHAPAWVIVLCGAVFVFAGLAVALPGRPIVAALLGNLIVASFAAIAAWVALRGPAAQFSGGVPLVPRELNVAIARGLFGLGALVCALILIPGLKHLHRLVTEH